MFVLVGECSFNLFSFFFLSVQTYLPQAGNVIATLLYREIRLLIVKDIQILSCFPGGYFHRNAIRGFDKKSLNMGPIFDPQIPKHGSIFRQNHKNFLSPENFQKIPKHGSIFLAKSLNMGIFLPLNMG